MAGRLVPQTTMNSAESFSAKRITETHSVGSMAVQIWIDRYQNEWWVGIEGREPVLIERYDSLTTALEEIRETFLGAFSEHQCTSECQAGGAIVGEKVSCRIL